MLAVQSISKNIQLTGNFFSIAILIRNWLIFIGPRKDFEERGQKIEISFLPVQLNFFCTRTVSSAKIELFSPCLFISKIYSMGAFVYQQKRKLNLMSNFTLYCLSTMWKVRGHLKYFWAISGTEVSLILIKIWSKLLVTYKHAPRDIIQGFTVIQWRKMSSKTKIWAWISIESTVHCRRDLNYWIWGNQWIKNEGKNEFFLIRGKFQKKVRQSKFPDRK